MRAWLVYDREGAGRNEWFIGHIIEEGKKHNIDIGFVLLEDVFVKDKKTIVVSGEIPKLAFVRTICPVFSAILEEMGVRVCNSARVSEFANHKGKCIEFVRNNTGVPCIPTETFSVDVIDRDFLNRHNGFVIKSVSGHGGKRVYFIDDKIIGFCEGEARDDREIKNAIAEDGNEFVLQPFIRGGGGEDVRVFVVGGKIVAAVKRTAGEGEFRANYSLGGTVSLHFVDSVLKGYVDEIVNVLPLDMAGIDFLIDERGDYYFSEIEDVVGSRMLYKCADNIDIVNIFLDYIVNS